MDLDLGFAAVVCVWFGLVLKLVLEVFNCLLDAQAIGEARPGVSPAVLK